MAGFQVTNDYKGSDFTATLTAVNTDVVQNSGSFCERFWKLFSFCQVGNRSLWVLIRLGVLIGHYLQRVSQNLDLGTELIMQYGKSVPNGRMAFYSLGWRYFGKQWQLSGTLNPLGSLHLCYHHQSTSPIQFGVELESNIRTMESQCTFGYQVDLNKANMTFRG